MCGTSSTWCWWCLKENVRLSHAVALREKWEEEEMKIDNVCDVAMAYRRQAAEGGNTAPQKQSSGVAAGAARARAAWARADARRAGQITKAVFGL